MRTPPAEHRYEAIVYHDEPEDAATDSRTIGYYRARTEAIKAVRATFSDYWNSSGQVVSGTYYPAVLGVRPDNFESTDQDASWLVGPDWIDR